MIRALLLFCAGLAIAGCKIPERPAYYDMDDFELASYNATLPLEDRVYCVEDVRIGSHIREKHCATFISWVESRTDSFMWLGTLNSGGSFLFK